MTGVNVTNMDKLIIKNNALFDNYSKNSKKVVESIFELDDCYSGKSLNYLFSHISSQVSNLKMISNLIENYSDYLYSIKMGYIKQDQVMTNKVSRINSKMQ